MSGYLSLCHKKDVENQKVKLRMPSLDLKPWLSHLLGNYEACTSLQMYPLISNDNSAFEWQHFLNEVSHANAHFLIARLFEL